MFVRMKLKLKAEIWNIFVVSMLLMICYAALNPACALINTTLQDSNSHLTSKLGYISQSVMSLVSIAGGLLAPPLRSVLGYRLMLVSSALLHAGVYVGMILLSEWAILFGSVLTGLGEGIIWVVIPNYVAVVSEHKNIERNLSYHMVIYNFNGVAGNILNYFCLDDSRTITSSSRLRYFTVCTVMTVTAAVVGGMTLCSTKKAPEMSSLDDDNDIRLISDNVPDTSKLLSDSDSDQRSTPTPAHPSSFYQRTLGFLMDPRVRALTISNAYFGVACTLIVIVPMCITNTWENRKLIPLLGGIIGVSRMLSTCLFDLMAKLTSYYTLQYLQTLAAVTWVTIVFLVFPNNSLHALTPGDYPIYPVGDWVVYILGVLTGCCLTWLGVLVTVATGKISMDTGAMRGFESDVLVAWGMIVWSIGSSVSLAFTPYVSLYMFCCLTLFGAIVNHFYFFTELLPHIGQFKVKKVSDKEQSY